MRPDDELPPEQQRQIDAMVADLPPLTDAQLDALADAVALTRIRART